MKRIHALLVVLFAVTVAWAVQAQSFGPIRISIPSTASIDALTLVQNNSAQDALDVTGRVTQAGGIVTQSSTTFTGGFAPSRGTLAQIKLLTPYTTGQVIACSDCGFSKTCISTSVWVNSFVVIAGTPTVCQ